jgi:ABC-type branched-subunit amino acid transport system substrate-binding protein
MASVRTRWIAVVLGVVALGVIVAVTVAAAQWVTRGAESGADSAADSEPSGSLSPSPTETPCTVDRLVIGALTPQTGSLAFLGPPQDAGIALALSEINDAGGVLGSPVREVPGDASDAGTGIGVAAAEAMIAQGAQAIIGATSSAGTLEIIDQVTGAGVLLMSPASTSPALSTYPDEGLFFRVVPSDALQGAALADVARDLGLMRAASIVRADAFGIGVQAAFEEVFAARGGTVVGSARYETQTRILAPVVAQVAQASPDVVLVVGLDESAAMIREMVRQGIGPADVQVLVAEGGLSTTIYDVLPRGTMEGVLGSVPVRGPMTGRKAFHERLLSTDPTLTTFAYGAEAYDATMLIALAADYAGCADAASIASALPLVANTNPGSAVCGTYADCREIIQRGGQPNYEGTVGSLGLSEDGEPTAGYVELVRFASNTRYVRVEVVGPLDVPAPALGGD